jgi:alpha-tubulin suppressor-like RCC1 family protein
MGDNTAFTPQQIVSNGVIAIACGWDHTLFLKSDASLWATGNNSYGQLGDGFGSTSLAPEQIVPLPQPVFAVPGLTAQNTNEAVKSISAGVSYSLFVKSGGTLWGMGANSSGQLGNGTFSNVLSPEQIDDGVTAVAANCSSVGGGIVLLYHTLLVKTNGSLWAMGWNKYGQLGDGTLTTTNRPEQIVSNGVVAIAAGVYHSLFLKSDGSLWAMGRNSSGQLGDGSFISTNRPEQIVPAGVATIAAGGAHNLFLKSDDSLWAMGDNHYGQLGIGTLNNNTNLPQQIVSSNVVAIAAGLDHSLFLKSDGSLWAMGYNFYGQLGDGTTNTRSSPVEVVSNNVVAIAAGTYHSLFLKSDGSLWAMGWNGFGQLGDGTLNNTNRPEKIISSGVIAIAGGYSHSLFVKTDGTLWGMGDNSSAELGSGTGSSTVPRQLTGGTDSLSLQATCLAGGTYYLLASTNVALPLSQWTRILTNSVSLRGANNFSAIQTNVGNSGAGRQFFILQSQ